MVRRRILGMGEILCGAGRLLPGLALVLLSRPIRQRDQNVIEAVIESDRDSGCGYVENSTGKSSASIGEIDREALARGGEILAVTGTLDRELIALRHADSLADVAVAGLRACGDQDQCEGASDESKSPKSVVHRHLLFIAQFHESDRFRAQRARQRCASTRVVRAHRRRGDDAPRACPGGRN